MDVYVSVPPPSPQFLPTETIKTDSTFLLKLGQAGKLGSDKRPDLCSLLACKNYYTVTCPSHVQFIPLKGPMK